MSFHVTTHPQAEEDIRQAMRWISQYSPQKATLWYFEVLEAIDSLQNFPARCSFAPERQTFKVEIRHLLFDKYRILFVIEDETVYVLRVQHQAQQSLQPDENEDTEQVPGSLE